MDSVARIDRSRARRFLIGALAILALSGTKPTGQTAALLRHEGERISGALGSAPAAGDALPPSPSRDAVEICRAEGMRRVNVSTADQLASALDEARPGDHIRMADGVYHGRFVLERSGTSERPITLCGSRGAILDAGSVQSGYALHLRDVQHLQLIGFTVRNGRKGIMADRAKHNLIRGVEVRDIGDEGVHLRAGSSDNIVRECWIHDVGLDTPLYGEAVYLGSARSNWGEHSGGLPDASDRNQVVGNVLGPGVRAEGVDAKEGTRGGVIADNLFFGTGATAADSWIDLKCNDYRVERNRGTFDPRQPWRGPVDIIRSDGRWGEGNVVRDNVAIPASPKDGVAWRVPGRGRATVTLVLPGRGLPYELPEISVCFPQTLTLADSGVWTLHEPIVAGSGSHLLIQRPQVRELRIRSTDGSFAAVVGVANQITLRGSNEGQVRIRSWDPEQHGPDRQSRNGRAYVCSIGGRMDLDLVELTDLGFGTGWTSGAAWKNRGTQKGHGDVRRSRFERNYFGAYTFECDSMRWTENVFANNEIYGFDPHDNSDWFVVTGNEAFGNKRHGIIFSRGCRGNILRGNRTYANRGHGIMFDDGLVADDGDPRHIRPVPPVGNVLEENEIWGNEVGIALQGCLDHVIRNNRIRDNRFGVRLDQSDRNELADNQVLRSRQLGIHLTSGSDENHVHGNRIEGGQAGIVALDSRGNVIEKNSIRAIVGQGIRVAGQAAGTSVVGNGIVGRGSRAIDMTAARSVQVPATQENSTGGWMSPHTPLPALVLWATILGVPVFNSLVGIARRIRRRRKDLPGGIGSLLLAAGMVVGATGSAYAAAQRLSFTASLSAVHDDNTFKYSDTQLRDIEAGVTPYRYGITRPGDLVVGPSLAVQWQQDLAAARRRSLRVRADAAFHGTNPGANFTEVDAVWRESFAGVRRLSLGYGFAPDRLLRKLYDADLTSVPSTARYRDARYDAHSAFAAWRHAVPRATWLEWTYQFDRRIHDPAFRERDSDFHTLEAGLGWEGLARTASVHLTGGHTWRFARAEDGDPGLEGDLSFHGPGFSLDGRIGLWSFMTCWLFVDGAYGVDWRTHDADRPTDTANFGRKDVVQSIESGLGVEAAPNWRVRAFYRHGRARANVPAQALDAELGNYDQNQFGVEVDWASVLQGQARPRTTLARRFAPDSTGSR